jgi:hypothetical protein
MAMKHGSKASDESLMRIARVLVDQMDVLSKHDPKICHCYLFPRPGVWTDLS